MYAMYAMYNASLINLGMAAHEGVLLGIPELVLAVTELGLALLSGEYRNIDTDLDLLVLDSTLTDS